MARRVLTKFGLADTYKGQEEPDGEDFNVEAVEDGPRPFYCLLDSGLKRTSTGSKVFAALKGALDGGLDIPHNEKRFVGFGDKKLDAEVLKKYIFGGHVAEYQETMQVRPCRSCSACMQPSVLSAVRDVQPVIAQHPGAAAELCYSVLVLCSYLAPLTCSTRHACDIVCPACSKPCMHKPTQEEEPEKYQSHFSAYVEEGIEPDGLEDLYTEVRVPSRGKRHFFL